MSAPSCEPKFRTHPFTAVGLTLVACLAYVTGCDTTAARFTGGAAPSPAPPVGQALQSPDELGAAGAAGEAVREIEEADVVKQVGDRIYVLNRHKGLVIVGVADPDAPTVLGSLELRGRPIEMIVVGTRAYVILSADFGYEILPATGVAASSSTRVLPPAPDYDGSRVAIVDVTDAAHPTVLGKINLAGYAQASRRVGDVLYVAGQNLPSTEPTPIDPNGGLPRYMYDVDRGFVASINIGDPNNVVPVDRKTFRGGQVDMHVSVAAIFAASARYDSDLGQSFTRVQYVDITDPAGAIALRGTVDVPGRIRNRFYMDDFSGVFRITTESWGFGFQQVRLFTYNLADPDAIALLGQTEIIQDESLEAVRYDGTRAYAVTFLRIDPLFVIDLSDPADPRVVGALEVPGFSTHIEPRGDRLIAVGIDDTEGRRPAVAYYDVSNPAAPSQIGRVVLGPPFSFTESEAVYDEKAFKIIDDLGLIVIPFSHVEYSTDPVPLPGPIVTPGGTSPPGLGGGAPVSSASRAPRQPRCVNAVQLVDFNDTALTQRGWFDARARVHRVGFVGERIYAVSQASLQTVNIADRDHPAQAGEAMFFDAEQLAELGIGCGDVYFIEPLPPDVIVLTPEQISRLLTALDEVCGMTAAMPMIALVAGMVGIRRRARRRR